MKKRKKIVQCRVRGNKVFFYGKTAKLIQKAIDVSGRTPEEFLSDAINNSVAYYKVQGILK